VEHENHSRGEKEMKRIFWIVPAILLLSISARAQERATPAWEISGGYSYLDANLGRSNFRLNGATASATENLNSVFGGRVEVSVFHGTEAGTTVSAQTVTYGPVLSYRKLGFVTPYVHVQLGAIHASQGYLGISQSAIKFAAAGGAGFDVHVTKMASLRVQADYLLTRFLTLNQYNLQGSVGLVFHFGRK
jgi:Outer membrane protein beta-barrel domain